MFHAWGKDAEKNPESCDTGVPIAVSVSCKIISPINLLQVMIIFVIAGYKQIKIMKKTTGIEVSH